VEKTEFFYSKVFKHKAVEEMGVGIPQVAEINIFLNRGRLWCQLLHAPLRLEGMSLDIGRGEAVDPKLLPDFNGIRGIRDFAIGLLAATEILQERFDSRRKARSA
jgi:hypothetical protein